MDNACVLFRSFLSSSHPLVLFPLYRLSLHSFMPSRYPRNIVRLSGSLVTSHGSAVIICIPLAMSHSLACFSIARCDGHRAPNSQLSLHPPHIVLASGPPKHTFLHLFATRDDYSDQLSCHNIRTDYLSVFSQDNGSNSYLLVNWHCYFFSEK